MPETTSAHRWLAVAGIALTIALLIPGIVAPVITVIGTLDPEGVATLAPQLLEQGISDEAMASVRPMINPALLPLMELMPGGLKGAIVSQLGPQLAEQLRTGPEIQVYQQVRSILGSVQHLYRVGSFMAATLILLFSVVVPFTKAALVLWAVLQNNVRRRAGTLNFVEVIAKWSMADVFAVALIIVYLAAQASQSPPGSADVVQIVRFDADFGPGFYWFAAYCVVSLAVHQVIARSMKRSEVTLAQSDGPAAA